MNKLRELPELPKWLMEIYHTDALVQYCVKDWRMGNKPIESLYLEIIHKLHSHTVVLEKQNHELMMCNRMKSILMKL